MSSGFPPPPGDNTNKKSGNSVLIIFAAVFVGALCVCGGGFVALLLPAIQAARNASYKAVDMNNEKQIVMAMLKYEMKNRDLPPPYEADVDGKPKHSWRVLILPYFDDPNLQALYKQYDLNEPWDGPNNSKLANLMPRIYGCPGRQAAPNTPSYLAVVGDQTAWPAGKKFNSKGITDGLSNTILLAEVRDAGFNWLEPRDLSFDEAAKGVNVKDLALGISSNHGSGATVILADSHCVFLDNDVRPDVLKSLLTANGGEPVNGAEFEKDVPR